jgi:hypothetical protein
MNLPTLNSTKQRHNIAFDKQGYNFFFFSSVEKLIALFVDRSRPIKQANPKVLDYISQTMVYYPIFLQKGNFS